MEIRENTAKLDDSKVLGSAQYYVAYEEPHNAFEESLKGEPKEVELDELRDYRMSLGLTQKGVSHLTGITQSAVSAVELGKYEPSSATLKKIEKALNIKILVGASEPSEMRKEFIDLIQELAIIDDNLELYRQKLTLVENEIEALVTDREAIEKELESYKVMKVGDSK